MKTIDSGQRMQGRLMHQLLPVLVVLRLAFLVAAILLLAILLLAGCTQVQDFLNMRAPEVDGYSPRGEQLELEPGTPVRVRFSQPMNAARTEAAFTLERDGVPQSGRFGSTGRELVFYPDLPLHHGYRYVVRVGTDAEDLHGNSLEQSFSAFFTTVGWGSLRRVVEQFPLDNSVIESPRTEVLLQFDRPVEKARLLKEFRISPEVPGELQLSDNFTRLRFVPHEDWGTGRYYQVELGSKPEEQSGPGSIAHLVFGFRRESYPAPLTVSVLFEPSGVLAEPTPGMVSGVEVPDDIRIQFDVPVPPATQSRMLSLPAAAAGTVRWSEDADSVRISNLRLEYGESYELQVNELRYAFLVDGPRFRPPEVVAVSYRIDELSPVVLLEPFGSLVLGHGDGGVFEFELLHAPDTSLDPGKVIEGVSFGLSTGAGSIAVQSVVLSPAVTAGDGASATTKVQVGVATSLTGDPGLLQILVRESIADLRATSAERDFVRRVNF